MNNYPQISTQLANGSIITYNVILTFQSTTSANNYCIYTDNTLDKNQKLRFYVAKYDPKIENPFLGEPTTKEEWNEITKVINSVIPTI